MAPRHDPSPRSEWQMIRKRYEYLLIYVAVVVSILLGVSLLEKLL